jgi:hypothetical protein
VRIVIATAEPRGAYHIAPLYNEMKKCVASFTHLTPYPEAVQGKPWEDTSSEIDRIAKSDKVILAGGGYSAWTELVAHFAKKLGKEVIITELALGCDTDDRRKVTPDSATAISVASSCYLASYYGIDQMKIEITGTPLLDNLPIWRPKKKRVLFLSTSDSIRRDPDQLLKKIALHYRKDNWDVVVRTHPREDLSQWNEFELDKSENFLKAASSAEMVIGYPGTPLPITAALKVPVYGVIPNKEMSQVILEPFNQLITGWISSVAQIDDLKNQPNQIEDSNLEKILGPIGNSATRIINNWLKIN